MSRGERVGFYIKKRQIYPRVHKQAQLYLIPLVPKDNQLLFLALLLDSLHSSKQIRAIISWFVNFTQHLWIYNCHKTRVQFTSSSKFVLILFFLCFPVWLNLSGICNYWQPLESHPVRWLYWFPWLYLTCISLVISSALSSTYISLRSQTFCSEIVINPPCLIYRLFLHSEKTT